MRSRTIILIFCLLLIVASAYAQDPLGEAMRSHVDANVPEPKDFDSILKRDISAYVTDSVDRNISVTVELLRDRPTQSGVAFPKFYVWIEKRNAKGALLESAAARIAAIEKKRFEVVQYFARARLIAEPELMKKVFPDDVYEKILIKIKESEK